MADLALKLFEGELSEADWDSLIAQVEAGPEEAERLGLEAERRYAGFGLPEPRWGEGRGRGIGLWFGAAGAALLVTALLAWPERRTARPDLGLEGESFSVASQAQALARQAAPVPAGKGYAQGELLSVRVALARSEMATVEVVDAGGRRVRRIFSGLLKAGDWAFSWDGKLDGGGKPQSGTYSIVLKAGGATQRRSLVIE
jgi:hypothetical protein